jgi:hypothetical protein
MVVPAPSVAPPPPPPPPPPLPPLRVVDPGSSLPPGDPMPAFPFEATTPPAVERPVDPLLAGLPPIPSVPAADGPRPPAGGSSDLLPVPLLGPRQPAPPPPLEPLLPPSGEGPRIDADSLFLPPGVSAPDRAAAPEPEPEPAFDINDVPWATGKPKRVRDLLADPDNPEDGAAAEPSFFAPVTPEQLGEDPWPPPPPPPPPR